MHSTLTKINTQFLLFKNDWFFHNFFNLGNKLEDKDKILKVLKEEIEELLNPKQIPEYLKEDNDLIIKKLNRDKIDLEMNLNELKQQVVELEKKNKELNGKVC